jgi:hypothetical protein
LPNVSLIKVHTQITEPYFSVDNIKTKNSSNNSTHGPAGVFDNMSKRIYVIGGGIEPACCASNINEAFLAAKR